MSDETENEENDNFTNALGIFAQVVLFFLMFCFSATIHPRQFYKSLKSKGIFIGVGLQFVIMPLVGFITINIVDLNDASAITFMILLSSPGGAFSNFLNSIFNGDLSLSIAMTTVSTVAALPFLPFNLYLYLDLIGSSESEGAADRLDWAILARTVAILVSGVFLGLFANRQFPDYEKVFYRIGNVAAIGQIVVAMMTSNNDTPLWEKPTDIFVITLVAVIISLVLGIVTTLSLGMPKPEAFSVTIEVAVQNSAIAISFAFAAFEGAELSEALAIPVAQGIFATFLTLAFAIYGYNAGWTYSPKNETFLTAMVGYYQPKPSDEEHINDEVADLDEGIRDSNNGKPKSAADKEHTL